MGENDRGGEGLINFKEYPKGFIVKPDNEHIFSEFATEIILEDEAGGAFVVIKQLTDNAQPGLISVSSEDWPLIRGAIDKLVKAAEEINKETE